jgi:hypothetical protein
MPVPHRKHQEGSKLRLVRSCSVSRLCFVIAPIGDDGSHIRRRSDQVLTHIIDVAAKECDYETLRADKISEPGIITSQIIQHLLDDPLVIADITGHNPNVMYELAVRHATRKPVVQLIEKGEKIPFDVAATRTIQVDHHDLDSVAKCRQELSRQIRAVEKDPTDVDTPISVAIDLQQLRSGNPMEKNVAEMVAMLQSLHRKIDTMPHSVEAMWASYNTRMESELQSIHEKKWLLAREVATLEETLRSEKDQSRRDSLEKVIAARQAEVRGLDMREAITRVNLSWDKQGD